jgi:predicted ATPase/DNA-binding CsgD family transcriptional regulator
MVSQPNSLDPRKQSAPVSTNTRIPAPLTSLVGREAELSAVSDLLEQDRVRLLTLIGPGGIGKTSLALAAARHISDRYTGRVLFLELAAVRDPAMIVSEVARQLRIGLDQDGLPEIPADAELILVLDNLEQVAECGPQLAAMLRRVPGLRVVTTSRVALRVSGEHLFNVAPLGIDDAIALFLNRATAVRPGLPTNKEERDAIAEICRRIDCLPLAIELAASRMNIFTPVSLLARLDPAIPHLTGGARDQPVRLQTMRNAIAWSHDLLSPAERTLFRRMSVFEGGSTLAAIAAISGESDPLPPVERLVEHQLVRVLPGVDEPRFGMMETVREFALEQLEIAGERETMRNAHAAYFSALAIETEFALLLADGPKLLARLESEHPNFCAALNRLEETGSGEAMPRMSAALGRFFVDTGHYHDGRQLMARAVHLARTPAVRGKALAKLGLLEIYLGNGEAADRALTEAAAVARSAGDNFHGAQALVGLAVRAMDRGEHRAAAARLDEAAIRAETIGEARAKNIMNGFILSHRCVAARARGEFVAAARAAESAIDLYRAAGYPRGVALVIADLGDIARECGDFTKALACYREAFTLHDAKFENRWVTDLLDRIALVAIAAGQPENAARLFGAAAGRRERLGLHFDVPSDRLAVERGGLTARSQLGDERYAALYRSGRAANPEDIAAVALAVHSSRPVSPVLAGLTAREKEILPYLVAGMTDREIAERLILGRRTVESHVARILAKLGVTTRTAAAGAAIAAGLAAPTPPPKFP